MQIHFDYISAENLAVLVLTFIGGLALSVILKARGVGGCLTYILAGVVLSIIVVALIKGYSYLIEDMTYYLTEYIYYNSIGIVGFLLGFLVGLVIRRNRSKS